MNPTEVPKVAVLLAAYNGVQWLQEQLDSILGQINVEVTVFISVDLSSDGTHQFCQKLSDTYLNIHVLPYGEKFGGAAKNFYRLITEVHYNDYDFVSLADQDDIWKSDKLFNAVSKLTNFDVYSSNVTAFWENGKKCIINKAQPIVEYDYLFEAAGPGCTYVMKREFALHLKNFFSENLDLISHINLHDWLIYAFSRNFGYKWFIDKKSGMLYRQHAHNQVGANNNLKAIYKRFLLIKNKWYRNEIEKIVIIFSIQNDPFISTTILNGYYGNLKLLINISKIRRRFRDRALLSFVLLFNIF